VRFSSERERYGEQDQVSAVTDRQDASAVPGHVRLLDHALLSDPDRRLEQAGDRDVCAEVSADFQGERAPVQVHDLACGSVVQRV